MTARTSITWLPAVLVAPVVGVAAVTLALDLRPAAPGPAERIASDPGWGYVLNGLVLVALAAVVLRRRHEQRFGWALVVLGGLWALDGLAQAYVRVGLGADTAWPAMTLVLWFLTRFTAVLPVAVAVLLVIFPDGRLPSGRWAAVAATSLAVMGAAVAFLLVVPAADDLPALPPGVDLDAGTIPALEPFADLVPTVVLAGMVAFVVACASVVARYVGSRGVDRDRMRWLLWGIVVMLLAVAVDVLLDGVRLHPVTTFLIMVVPAVAMTIAIVSPRLVAIDDLLGTTLLYGGLSAVVVAVDLLVIGLVTAAAGDSLGQRQVVVLVLVLSAAVYAPLRGRLQAIVRRAMLGGRDNPYGAVAGLASTLETSADGPDQLAAVARSVADAFRVPFVSVEVDRVGGDVLVATFGTRPTEVRTLPITYREDEVGRLILPTRGLRHRLSRRDERLLGDLVRQAATAVRTARLAEELQASREQLVAAREEERRRIRRDLHDGLGPSLGGVVFRLESARLLVRRDPDAAHESLEATAALMQEVVADVRRLVHDLRPPALDDRGLLGALGQLAEDLPFPCTIEVAGLPDGLPGANDGLSAAVEVAAYRIVAEALTNVRRHAGADRCVVRLVCADGMLHIEIDDDGRGIEATAQAGVGLVSLRERAAELGGRCEVTCPPGGGTCVRAWLPLVPPAGRAKVAPGDGVPDAAERIEQEAVPR